MNKHTSRIPSSVLPVKSDMSDSLPMAGVYESIDTQDNLVTITIRVGDHEFSHTDAWYGENVKRILVDLAMEGYDLRCCATCAHFGTTGMVREALRGRSGYCILTTGPENLDTNFLTHALHWCKEWLPNPRGLT